MNLAILLGGVLTPLVGALLWAVQRPAPALKDEPRILINPAARAVGHFALAAKRAGYTVRIEHGGLDIRHPKAPRAKAFVRATGPRTVLLWLCGLDRYGQEVIAPNEKAHPCTYAEAGDLIGDWFRTS